MSDTSSTHLLRKTLAEWKAELTEARAELRASGEQTAKARERLERVLREILTLDARLTTPGS